MNPIERALLAFIGGQMIVVLTMSAAALGKYLAS